MITKKMLEKLNEQINKEMYSAYLYLSMSAYFESENLKGFANWMYIQHQEEMAHAMKIYHFVINRGAEIKLTRIEAPATTWKNAVTVFEDVLAHERKVTQSIHDLVSLAIELKDYGTESFLRWYVDEQVEEEANAEEILKKVILAHKEPSAMFFLDNELAQRTFVAPTA